MFLTKKWIIIVISITAISFVILLMIQFGWIRKSIEVNRQHFANRMIITTEVMCKVFFADKGFYKTYLADSAETQDLFKGDKRFQKFETIIKRKLDSVLAVEKMPLTATVSGWTGKACYLMKFIPGTPRNTDLDHASYQLCLCDSRYPAAFDIGFNLRSNKMLVQDSSALVIPSIILILLLIALFSYIIFVVNRQKSLAELKNDFINNLTHEFNTPLFSIGLTSNLLLRADPIQQSEKLKGYVELITNEKNRLQTQVDKILKLTAIESGSLILEKESVDMHRVIEQNIASFAAAIAEKGGNISFKAGASQYFVQGDQVHLFNALSNLLDNAYKYSDKIPEIVITTSNVAKELIISMGDKGIGMNKTAISMIFDKFYRVKHGDRHDVKGFGLGLSYVKKIVELHHGTIEVKSIPGEGSVFVIHLPYQH